MAGHRRALGRPTQKEARERRMQRRLASAQTPQQRAAAAFDGLRMAAHRSPGGAVALEAASRYMLELTAALAGSDGS